MIRNLAAFSIAVFIGLSLLNSLSNLTYADEKSAAMDNSFWHRNVIAVEGKIEDTSLLFILDTGAGATILHKDYEHILPASAKGAEVNLLTLSGVERRFAYENIRVSIGKNPVQEGKAVVFDLSEVHKVSGLKVGAILGTDYLQRFAFTMQDGIPNFTAPPVASPQETPTWPVSLNSAGCPEIPVEYPLLGIRNVTLDTGLTENLAISQAFADTLIRSGDAQLMTRTKFLDMSGVKIKSVVTIRELKILGVQFRNIPAQVGTRNNVGLGLLRYINFTVDFPKGIAYLHGDAPKGQDKFPVDASGLRVVWDECGFYRIRRIEAGSAAANADLRLGDEIEAISDLPTSTLSLWQIRQMLSQAGETMKITLKRNGESRSVDLPLKRDFEYPPVWNSRSLEAASFLDSLQQNSANN